ncbi:hypothetical protein [Georgenia sp. SYP-B2076]|uniref:hypothetical protein n=1 Tax=Georgenia sp. SYP-B2076 TaxID=2495881 RepID=UPI0013E0DBAF|nr:hypothetical protein [Georgenia sp. SYP-B2076]
MTTPDPQHHDPRIAARPRGVDPAPPGAGDARTAVAGASGVTAPRFDVTGLDTPGLGTPAPDLPGPGTPGPAAPQLEPDPADPPGPGPDDTRARHGAGRGADAAVVDDPESTAVRRQRLLRLPEDEPQRGGEAGPVGSPGADAGTSAGAAGGHAATTGVAVPTGARPVARDASPAAAGDVAPDAVTPVTAAVPSPGTAPVAGAAPDASTGRAEAPALRARWRDAPVPEADVVLAGATHTRARSRAAAHWWGLAVAAVLTPVAWYLVADGGARLTLGDTTPWSTGAVAPAALVELAGGLVVVALVMLAARWSSVGAIVSGALVLAAGAAFLAFPGETRELLTPVLDRLRGFNDLGGNVAHHLVSDGSSGRLALYGVALALLGVVSHGARRQGRREERARATHESREQPVTRKGVARHGSAR